MHKLYFMALRKKTTEHIVCGRDGDIDKEENVGKYDQIYSILDQIYSKIFSEY